MVDPKEPIDMIQVDTRNIRDKCLRKRCQFFLFIILRSFIALGLARSFGLALVSTFTGFLIFVFEFTLM